MRWEVQLVLHLTITAPSVALFLTWISQHFVEILRGSNGEEGFR